MENISNNMEGNNEMQLIPLLKLCYHKFLQNWYWFTLSVIVCVALGWIYLQRQSRVYERQSVMLIEEANTSGGNMPNMRRASRSNMTSLLELNGVSVGDNLKNEIFIISSKRLMQRVVEKLNLDVDYLIDEGLHHVPLYKDERPVEIIFQSPYTQEMAAKTKQASLNFDVKKKNANTVVLTGFKDKEGNKLPDISAQLGQTLQTPVGKLSVLRGKSFNQWTDEAVHVSRMPISFAANLYQSKLSASEFDKETSLIVLTCLDTHTKRADDILNTLYDTYKEDVVENKNRVALSTAQFIDERLQIIGNELSTVETQLADFKKRNQLIDFKLTSQAVLTETSTAHQQTLTIETQLNVAQFLNEYLSNHTNDKDLIPTLNLGDAGVNQQIAAFNTLMNQRNTLASNSSEQQTVVREMDRQLTQTRQAIASSLQNHINALKLQLRDARLNENLLTGQIAGAPDMEKQGIDIQRQQALKEALYTYLLNKREEVALQQAINEANVRLVEGPIGNRQVSPRSMVIMLLALGIGFAIPALIIWLMMTLDVTVHSRKDIENATTIPLLGEIPHMKNATGKTLINELPNDAPLVEAFRIMRFSLNYIRHATQVIMTTSTTPGQGKSFISRNVCITFAMMGKRTLLIDADIRKRTLSAHFGHHMGLTAYLSDNFTKVEDIIVKDGIAPGVDFMPAGSLPPNPSELLMSDRLDELMGKLREQYDQIIVDCTPMFAVADAGIVNRVVDITFFVIRAGVQERDFLPELERMYQENRLENLCIVLNDVKENASRYGSNYGSGYGYGYGYGRKQTRKSGILRRLRH
ncbi:polysaccharide biosynthesis tyrosine autokinase [bacterium]|nr:polysaccharide biosynthesis tyrosine autokinase [bacterium]